MTGRTCVIASLLQEGKGCVRVYCQGEKGLKVCVQYQAFCLLIFLWTIDRKSERIWFSRLALSSRLNIARARLEGTGKSN